MCFRRTPAQDHAVHLIESSPAGQVEPQLHTDPAYLKPGDRIEHTEPCLFDMVRTSLYSYSLPAPLHSNVKVGNVTLARPAQHRQGRQGNVTPSLAHSHTMHPAPPPSPPPHTHPLCTHLTRTLAHTRTGMWKHGVLFLGNF